MPIHARKRWVTCCPVLNAVLLRCKSQQCSQRYRLLLQRDWRSPFARPAPSSDSRRTAPSLGYPNNFPCGSCCPRSHVCSATPGVQHRRTACPCLNERLPGAVSQLVATLVHEAAASSVQDHFTITQANDLRLCCGQSSQLAWRCGGWLWLRCVFGGTLLFQH